MNFKPSTCDLEVPLLARALPAMPAQRFLFNAHAHLGMPESGEH